MDQKQAQCLADKLGSRGCNPLAETGRSKLQNRRAVLNQQILKAVRMRAGAENLLRATTSPKVREQVLLELSYVNSNLQILKEELEGLNISVEVYQNTEETFSIPLIPLGLKETKDVDFAAPLKDFILEHYSEDGAEYENEIADLMDLRQACRTPSRDESGVEMLMSYYVQLGFVENRILFNIGALYTQIGTKCNRQTGPGLQKAISAFQKAAGVLNYLKETFTHTPSYDMSPAMLSVLVKMMLAQVQECIFEQICLPGIRNEFFTLIKMAQEVAKLRNIEILQEILSVAHKRSLLKYTEQEQKDDFFSLVPAPNILSHTNHKIELIPPLFSNVRDLFEKLGPPAVFSAKQRWSPPRLIHFYCEDGLLGFTLKGGPPVQIDCIDPASPAALAGLKEGDIVIAVEGTDCKWLGTSEVLEKLQNLNEQKIEIQVISCQDNTPSLHNKCATYSAGMQKTYSLICLAMEDERTDKAKKVTPKLSFLSWGTKNRQKAASTLCLPSAVSGTAAVKKKLTTPFTLFNTDSSLY
ncbi:hypothetical protein E2320_001177 [Naja naja]|nr:hypothetical protein E2320_001177 [Naja naja]